MANQDSERQSALYYNSSTNNLCAQHHDYWLLPLRRGHLLVHSSAFSAAARQIKLWEVVVCLHCLLVLCSQLLPLQVRRASFTQPAPLKFFIRPRHDFPQGQRAQLCLSVCVCVWAARGTCTHVCVCVCVRAPFPFVSVDHPPTEALLSERQMEKR